MLLLDDARESQQATLSARLMETLASLHLIYHEIGYLPQAIAERHDMVFASLHSELQGYIGDAKREQETLRLECDWLRLHVLMVMAACDDPEGERLLPDELRQVVLGGSSGTSALEDKTALNRCYFMALRRFAGLYARYAKASATAMLLLKQLGPSYSRLYPKIPLVDGQRAEKFTASHCEFDDLVERCGSAPDVLNLVNVILRVELGRLPRKVQTPSPHTPRMQQLNAQLIATVRDLGMRLLEANFRALEQELVRALQEVAARQKRVVETATRVARLAAELGQEPGVAGVDNPGLLPLDALASLETLQTQLAAEKRQREADRGELVASVQLLWDQLREPETHTLQFARDHPLLSVRDLEAYRHERTRLVGLRRERVEQLILDTLVEVSGLWDKLGSGEDLRAQVPPSVPPCEETLQQLEHYRDQLAEELKELLPLLEDIARFEELLAMQSELEVAARDPLRLLLRLLLTILLAEERSRKHIARHMPRVVPLLRGKLDAFQRKHLRPAVFNGVDYSAKVAEHGGMAHTTASHRQRMHPPLLGRSASTAGPERKAVASAKRSRLMTSMELSPVRRHAARESSSADSTGTWSGRSMRSMRSSPVRLVGRTATVRRPGLAGTLLVRRLGTASPTRRPATGSPTRRFGTVSHGSNHPRSHQAPAPDKENSPSRIPRPLASKPVVRVVPTALPPPRFVPPLPLVSLQLRVPPLPFVDAPRLQPPRKLRKLSEANDSILSSDVDEVEYQEWRAERMRSMGEPAT